MKLLRRYNVSAADKRFEDVLRVHRDEQIRELKAENEALKNEITRLRLEAEVSRFGNFPKEVA